MSTKTFMRLIQSLALLLMAATGLVAAIKL